MRKTRRLIYIVVGVVFACLLVLTFESIAPSYFPIGNYITVPKGFSVTETAAKLKSMGFIRSTTMFRVYTMLLGPTTGVKTGNYYFGDRESALRVAYRMVHGDGGVLQVKVTVPEGLASPDIGRVIKKAIPTFDSTKFVALARPLEGYLFPDTYFFDRFTTPEDVISAMRDNFDTQTNSVQVSATMSGRTFQEVLTMASLVEEEANKAEDRRIIAGILWKRLKAGMALQVDAPFFYLFGKTSAELTRADLATSSPYNLYKHTGLPPTPIDNPGLESILDTLHSTETEYWYYLAGSDGKTHYAVDLDGHIANKVKYLR